MTGIPINISVIVPLYNEQENVVPLVQLLHQSLEPLNRSFEILLVDDGSSDDTFECAKGLVGQYPALRVVRFRRNFGQTPAMVAGIQFARGGILITMDGDLQNDPRDIESFLQKIDEGYDMVVGWRHNRQDKLITRKIPSMIANRLIAKVTGVPIKDNGCSLKAYRADIIKGVPLYSEMHRFIPAMSSLAGIKIYELKVRHHARRFGESKYGLSRTYKVLLDLLASPNLSDTSWIWHQYDHMVGTNTIVGPGGDAAVVRIRGTSRAVALTADCNARYCYLDPRAGAEGAVAEAARNVAAVGGTPLAITDCLNFGSPEQPEVMWQFEQAVDGLSEGCRQLGIAVVPWVEHRHAGEIDTGQVIVQ